MITGTILSNLKEKLLKDIPQSPSESHASILGFLLDVADTSGVVSSINLTWNGTVQTVVESVINTTRISLLLYQTH